MAPAELEERLQAAEQEIRALHRRLDRLNVGGFVGALVILFASTSLAGGFQWGALAVGCAFAVFFLVAVVVGVRRGHRIGLGHRVPPAGEGEARTDTETGQNV